MVLSPSSVAMGPPICITIDQGLAVSSHRFPLVAALCARPVHWEMKGILLFNCPHFTPIHCRFHLVYQDADGAMQSFVWHKDQKAVCHCLAVMLNLTDEAN